MLVGNPFVSFPATTAPSDPQSTGVDLDTGFGIYSDFVVRFSTASESYDLNIATPGTITVAICVDEIETAMALDGSFALNDIGSVLVGGVDTDFDVNGSGTTASATISYAVNVGTLHYYNGSTYEIVTKIEHGYGSFTQLGTDALF